MKKMQPKKIYLLFTIVIAFLVTVIFIQSSRTVRLVENLGNSNPSEVLESEIKTFNDSNLESKKQYLKDVFNCEFFDSGFCSFRDTENNFAFILELNTREEIGEVFDDFYDGGYKNSVRLLGKDWVIDLIFPSCDQNLDMQFFKIKAEELIFRLNPIKLYMGETEVSDMKFDTNYYSCQEISDDLSTDVSSSTIENNSSTEIDYLKILNSSQTGDWEETPAIQDIGQIRLFTNFESCFLWEFENGLQVERASEPMQIYQGVVLVGNYWILNDYSRDLACATNILNILGGIKIN